MKPYTLYKLLVDKQSYDVIVNFCQDHKINNVPSRECMFFEAGCLSGYQEPKKINSETTYLMKGLYLEVADAISGDGKVLLLSGTSPSLEEKFYDCLEEVEDDIEVLFDEPTLAIVISNDYEGYGKDLEYIETALKSYLDDTVKFSEMRTEYTNEEDLENYLLDGRKSEQD